MKNLASRTLCCTFLTALCMGTSSAQTGGFEIGIEGGPSWVTLRGNRIVEEGQRLRTTFAGGLSFQKNFGGSFSIRSNVHYDRKGSLAKILFTDNTGATLSDGKAFITLDYITMPLLARLSFGGKTKFIANAGPYLGILLKATQTFEATGLTMDYTNDLTDDMESIDVGLAAGIGAARTVGGRWILSAELRENLGLTNVSAIPVYDDGTIQTNAITLLIGLACSFGERGTSPAP